MILLRFLLHPLILTLRIKLYISLHVCVYMLIDIKDLNILTQASPPVKDAAFNDPAIITTSDVPPTAPAPAPSHSTVGCWEMGCHDAILHVKMCVASYSPFSPPPLSL
jgi:hypothetical protein